MRPASAMCTSSGSCRLPMARCCTNLCCSHHLMIRARARIRSDAGVPLITVVFPVAAVAASDGGEALDQLDSHHVLRMLVSELALDAQSNRRAVGDRQVLAVEPVCEDRLRMHCIVHVDALVVVLGC